MEKKKIISSHPGVADMMRLQSNLGRMYSECLTAERHAKDCSCVIARKEVFPLYDALVDIKNHSGIPGFSSSKWSNYCHKIAFDALAKVSLAAIVFSVFVPMLMAKSPNIQGDVNPALDKYTLCHPMFDPAKYDTVFQFRPPQGVTSWPYRRNHLIPIKLGGSNDPKNLWIQDCRVQPDCGKKDWIDNDLYVEMCCGNLTLEDAQKEIAEDWYAAWKRRQKTPWGIASMVFIVVFCPVMIFYQEWEAGRLI